MELWSNSRLEFEDLHSSDLEFDVLCDLAMNSAKGCSRNYPQGCGAGGGWAATVFFVRRVLIA